MRAVQRDVERVCRQPVVGEVVVQGTLAVTAVAVRIDAYNRSPVTGPVTRPVVDTESGHNLDVLGGIAADLGEVLQLFSLERERFFSRVDGCNCEILHAGNFDGLAGATYRERDVYVSPLAAAKSDFSLLVTFEAGGFHCQRVGSDWHRREGVVPLPVGNGLANRT